MAHGDAPEGKWRGIFGMEWVASTLYTTSELGISSITTAMRTPRLLVVDWTDVPTFKCTSPFRRKTKSGFCACSITFRTHSSTYCYASLSFIYLHCRKSKAIPLQAWTGPEVSRRFQDSLHINVARLSALRTGRLYTSGNIPGTHFC
jgi:hypothetical protein